MEGIEWEMSEILGELWGTLSSTKILAVTTDRLVLYTIYLVGVNFLPYSTCLPILGAFQPANRVLLPNL